MGIYWYAIDFDSNEKITPPKDFSINTPGIFHPTNPFPNMVMMMNSLGSRFELINDCNENIYSDAEYKDITDEVYFRYLQYFPWAKDKIYEPKKGN
jgi:hypothetical protein